MEGRRPYGRMALIGALVATTTATGIWGWRKFRSPSAKAQPPVVASPDDPYAHVPPHLRTPAHWQNRNSNVQQVGYNEAVAEASPAAGAPADSGPALSPPAADPTLSPPGENPYRNSRRGGGFASASGSLDASPVAPIGEPPPWNATADAAPLAVPENPASQPAPVDSEPPPATLAPPIDNSPPVNNAPPRYEEPARSAPPRRLVDEGVGLGNDRTIRSVAAHLPEGAAVPGDRRLEGPQAPAVAIEKSAPPEIQIGKKATFLLRVRNIGQSPAAHVVVTDHVPRGTSLVDTRPQAQVGQDGVVTWEIGRLEPGADATLEMVLMPEQEGQIGSVAQVTCQALATTRTVCTRPALVVDHAGPQQVLLGEPVSLAITISNPGTGPATGIVIEEDVPEGLSHAAGRELEYEVGTLRPGESRRMELTLVAAKPGIVENIVVARGEGNLRTEHKVRVEVIAPQLQVGVAGPKRRYLDRQATYSLTLANPGTAVAKNIDMVAFLPRGMKFVGADSEGQYDATRHAVLWALEELPAGKSGAVKLTTVPLEPGEHVLRVESRGDRNLTSGGEQLVVVEASPELLFSVVDASDPIEVGSDTSYEIRIVNNGTRASTNVRLAVAMPPEMRALKGDGPTRATGDEQRILFEPLPRLQPREEAIFRVTAQAVRAGDTRVRVQVSSDDEPTPVTKEESTRVYADQ